MATQTSTAAAVAPARLTRAAAAKLPKVTEATHFLLAAPLLAESDDEEDDDDFDPDQDDSFLSDDEPDAVIPLDEFDPANLKRVIVHKTWMAPLEPEAEKRADELEAAYQAAVAAAAAQTTPSPPLVAQASSEESSSGDNAADDEDEAMTVEDEAAVQAARKVDELAAPPSPSPTSSFTSPFVSAYFADWPAAQVQSFSFPHASPPAPGTTALDDIPSSPASFLRPPVRAWLYSSSRRPAKAVAYVEI